MGDVIDFELYKAGKLKPKPLTKTFMGFPIAVWGSDEELLKLVKKGAKTDTIIIIASNSKFIRFVRIQEISNPKGPRVAF